MLSVLESWRHPLIGPDLAQAYFNTTSGSTSSTSCIMSR